MSIIPAEWSKPDNRKTIPDVTLRYETYFGPDDFLWTVDDFLLVDLPGTQDETPARKGEGFGGVTVTQDETRWFVTLAKQGEIGAHRARRTVLYDDFKNSMEWRRVRNSSKDDTKKPVYRGASEASVIPNKDLGATRRFEPTDPRMDLAHSTPLSD